MESARIKWWSILPNYYVAQNNKLEMKIKWKDMYGKLKNGYYRLLKRVNDEYISVEFSIK